MHQNKEHPHQHYKTFILSYEIKSDPPGLIKSDQSNSKLVEPLFEPSLTSS